MADVFLSYAREDTGVAEKLARLLTGNGLDVWWDRRLFPGDDLYVEIERALKQARCAIVLWSPHSVRSHWVLGEAQTALDLGKMVSLQIAECEVPIPFRTLHTPKLYESDHNLADLAKLLTEKLAGGSARAIVFAPETTSTFLTDYREAMNLESGDTYWEGVKRRFAFYRKYPVRMTLLIVALAIVIAVLQNAFDASSMDPELKSLIGWSLLVAAVAYAAVKWPRKR